MAPPASSPALGTLVVVVLKARNLPDKHTISKQDPYVVGRLGGAGKSTQIDKRGGQHPIWNEELHFPVFASSSQENITLKISCFAKEHKVDDLIGSAEVNISETLRTGEFDDWVPLQTPENIQRGEIYLEMTYFASKPPPGSQTQAAIGSLTPYGNVPLQRRLSKLSPAERLWRPSPKLTPQSNSGPGTAQASPHSSPSHSPLPPKKMQLALASGGYTSGQTMPMPQYLYGSTATAQQRPYDHHTTQSPVNNQNTSNLNSRVPPPLPAKGGPSSSQGIPIPSYPVSQPPRQPQHQPQSYIPNQRPEAPLLFLPNDNNGETGGSPGLQSVPSILKPRRPKQKPATATAGSNVMRIPGSYESDGDDEDDLDPLPDPYSSSSLQYQPRPSNYQPYAQPQTQTQTKTSSDATSVASLSQEMADAELARSIAMNEGIDVERLRMEEMDREFARKLAEEEGA